MCWFSLLTVLTQKSIREAKFSSSILRVPATVTGEQFFSTSRLGRLRPIVHEPPASEEICHGREEVSDGVKKLGICSRNEGCGQEDPEESHGVTGLVSGTGVTPDC